MTWLRMLTALVFPALLLLAGGAARAHTVAPVMIAVEESSRSLLEVRATWPAGADSLALDRLEVVPPADCRSLTPARVSRTGPDVALHARYRCERTLAGRSLQLPGIEAAQRHVFVRYERADGYAWVALLDAGQSAVAIPGVDEAPGAGAVAGSYLVIGVEHILLGFDHLLFVLCLVLLVGFNRRLVVAVTTFTLAHSVTLVLAALELVSVPGEPVEAVIALSIVLLAVEILHQQRGTLSWTAQHPWLVSLGFGLIHGLGFAGALEEVGLPGSQLPLALAMFNVGVELGQLAFVLVLFAAWRVARRGAPATASRDGHVAEPHGAPLQGPVPTAAAWVSGVLASFWLFERLL